VPDPIHDYEQVSVYAKSAPQSSDVVRLERERARRGLAQEKR
jgi:hypothetical protein